MSDDGRDETATKREGFGSLHKEVPGLDRGSTVGRYVVLDVIGQGGMGIVYAAYDPELDRKVALKLLQAGAAGSGSTAAGSQTWLLREAQAMARLAHPNVIAVHDVGTFGDRVFVAMELVDGMTLREWSKASPRGWRDVLAVMRAAGAGLAAAHAVGLVHRDFKPDNVLVGTDGRVRVMDFGLARMRTAEATPASRDSDLAIESRSPLTDNLTEAGTVMGTPSYMAPEIHDGLGANARTDQFAFGVTLYEALYRQRPYDKSDLVPDRETVPVAKPPPEGIQVPARVLRAALRAIAPDPAARFVSMDELLAELATDPFAGRRKLGIAAGASLLALTLVGGAVLLRRGHSGRLCTGTERALANVWDAPIKLAVRTGFTATKKPYAEAAYTSLEHELDRYTQEWTEATVGNCEATRIRGEQTEPVFAARQLCLDQKLEGVRALATVLKEPSDALVGKADQAVFELDPLTACANTEALIAPDRATLTTYVKISSELMIARAQMIAAQYLGALTAMQHVIDEARAIHADDLVAVGLTERSSILQAVGNMKDGLAAADEATWLALRTHHDAIAASAALVNATAQAEHADALAVAQLWLDLAAATSSRAPMGAVFEFQLLETRGAILSQRGELQAAIEAHEKALAVVKALGPKNPYLWGAELNLAATLDRAGAYVAAIPHLEHALALREAAVGADHPDLAIVASNLGASYDHANDPVKATAAFQRALAIREKTYGANSPMLVTTLNNLGDFEAHHGKLAQALADVERAKAIAVRVPGTTNPLYHTVATTYAEVLGESGKIGEARAAFEAVLALETKLGSPELGTTLAARGTFELAQKSWAEAIAYSERAIAAFEASGGPEHLSLWKPLANLATAKHALDPKADVKPLLERAIAIGTKAQLAPNELQPLKDQLATL